MQCHRTSSGKYEHAIGELWRATTKPIRTERCAADDSSESDSGIALLQQRKTDSLQQMKRITQPSDVAKAAVYLASDDASFVTGTCLDVDGGRGI